MENIISAKNLNTKPKSGKREVLIDFIRGILMVWVMFDHFLFDAGFVFYYDFKTSVFSNLAIFGRRYFESGYRAVVHPIVLFLFFFISGLVFIFSNNKLKRGIKLSIVAVLLFAVTKIFSLITKTNSTITFGVIYVFALSGLIGWALEKIKTNKYVYLTLGVIIAAVGLLYVYGVITFLSQELYFIFYNQIGYTVSADYFPLFPYLGYFLIGIFLGGIIYKDKKPKIVLPLAVNTAISPVSFIGRYSLYFYLCSQIVFIAFFYISIILGA